MPFLLVILLLALPALELTGLILAGEKFGAIPVIAEAILSAIAGVNLLRITGWVTARKVQDAMMKGELPVGQMFEGAALSIASILLIIPGFLTDAIGLLLLIAPLRTALGAAIAARTAARATHHSDEGVIEGEFTVVEDPAPSDPGAPAAPLPPPTPEAGSDRR
jgi:UPF0716 protein FxsA